MSSRASHLGKWVQWMWYDEPFQNYSNEEYGIQEAYNKIFRECIYLKKISKKSLEKIEWCWTGKTFGV